MGLRVFSLRLPTADYSSGDEQAVFLLFKHWKLLKRIKVDLVRARGTDIEHALLFLILF